MKFLESKLISGRIKKALFMRAYLLCIETIVFFLGNCLNSAFSNLVYTKDTINIFC